MVLQRLANLPLLYHWRFFFPMVYVELFRFTRRFPVVFFL